MLEPALSSVERPRALPAEAQIAEAVGRLDEAELGRRYRDDGGLLVIEGALPGELCSAMVAEALSLSPRVRRSHVPWVRKGGAVPHGEIERGAPALLALQRSPSLLSLFERLVGPSLSLRKNDDPHASALYFYQQKGDHVGWHHDDCGCEPEASFTVLLGLVDEGSSRLEVELHRSPERGARRYLRSIPTRPGTLVFLCGSAIYHRVTPLTSGRRVSFSFEYVKDNRHPRGLAAAWQRALDTSLYFGPRELWRRRGR